MLSPEVKDLYETENQNNPANIDGIGVLTKTEMEFVINLMEYTESVWSYSATSAMDFSKNLGYSKSKLYRTMMQIVGKSPNVFLKEYRLNKALHILNDQKSNISEIAYQTGFSSPTYFSKCFHEVCGKLPSQHLKVL